jgi:hypothetical protein
MSKPGNDPVSPIAQSSLFGPCDTAGETARGMEAIVSLSVADLLERELETTIKEWLSLVSMVPELAAIALSDAERASHLPQLCRELISRLRLGRDAPSSISAAAVAHGRTRREQGYSVPLLVEESRAFQVATFTTLHLHQSELDRDQVLLDVIVIADEVDLQLAQSASSLVSGASV